MDVFVVFDTEWDDFEEVFTDREDLLDRYGNGVGTRRKMLLQARVGDPSHGDYLLS